MPAQILKGDTVRLKSAGPLMTVVQVSEDNARCIWFDMNNHVQVGHFQIEFLVSEPVHLESVGSFARSESGLKKTNFP